MRFIIESIGLTAGGGRELALDLIGAVADHHEHQFTLFIPDLECYKNISGSNLNKVVWKKPSGLLERAFLLNRMLPNNCRKERADALLCLGNFVPRNPPCPTVVLLHNPWVVYVDPVAKKRLTLREKLIVSYGSFTYRHLRRDVTIVTQTAVMKNRLCRRYDIDPARVTVIPNKLSLGKIREKETPHDFMKQSKRERFTFLCLARYYAHKNIEIILDALLRLPQYTRKPAKCLITIASNQHPGAAKLLNKIQSLADKELIQNIGPVSQLMLPALYRSADALIFPTLLESFSRTYSEAMYFCLPILTSDRDFAHQLCRDAAVYFDPQDADDIAQAMARVMEDGELRRRLVTNGRQLLRQAADWEDIAGRFVAVLESAALGRSPAQHKPELHSVDSCTRA